MNKFTDYMLSALPRGMDSTLSPDRAQQAADHILDELVKREKLDANGRKYLFYTVIAMFWQYLGHDTDEVLAIADRYADPNDPVVFRIKFDRQKMTEWLASKPQAQQELDRRKHELDRRKHKLTIVSEE